MTYNVKIKSIVPSGLKTVHDIEVEDAHHYILGSGTISHNSGIIFSSSIIIAMRKLKLKKDENGTKTTTVQGIRSACSVAKTRYAKPFEKIELEIPYNTGLSPYSGLFEYSQSKGLLTKSGNRWQYISKDGTEHKYYEKEYNKNIN